jgi:hypothetical protein
MGPMKACSASRDHCWRTEHGTETVSNSVRYVSEFVTYCDSPMAFDRAGALGGKAWWYSKGRGGLGSGCWKGKGGHIVRKGPGTRSLQGPRRAVVAPCKYPVGLVLGAQCWPAQYWARPHGEGTGDQAGSRERAVSTGPLLPGTSATKRPLSSGRWRTAGHPRCMQ